MTILCHSVFSCGFPSWSFQYILVAILNVATAVPPGVYYIDGSMSFTASEIQIDAYGVTFNQHGTSDTTVVLNSGAVADESVMEHSIYWNGGKFTNSTVYSGNSNIGICTRGTYYVHINDVAFEHFGTAGVRVGVRDNLWVTTCRFRVNDVHISQDDWVTTGGNPQIVSVNNCSFTTHYTAGIQITDAAIEWRIFKCSMTGDDCIVFYSGSS